MTLPFSGSPGESVVFALKVSGQSAGLLCFLIPTYSHFCLLLPGVEAGLSLGAICPGCRGNDQEQRQTVLLISAVKYLQEIDLGVSARRKPRQPLVAPEKLFLITASLSITACFLYLPKLPSSGHGGPNLLS